MTASRCPAKFPTRIDYFFFVFFWVSNFHILVFYFLEGFLPLGGILVAVDMDQTSPGCMFGGREWRCANGPGWPGTGTLKSKPTDWPVTALIRIIAVMS